MNTAQIGTKHFAIWVCLITVFVFYTEIHAQQASPNLSQPRNAQKLELVDNYPQLLKSIKMGISSESPDKDASIQKLLNDRAWVKNRPPIECELSSQEEGGIPVTTFRVLTTDAQIVYGDKSLIYYGQVARPYFYDKSPPPPTKGDSEQFQVFTVMPTATPDELLWLRSSVNLFLGKYQPPGERRHAYGVASIKNSDFTVIGIGNINLTCKYLQR